MRTGQSPPRQIDRSHRIDSEEFYRLLDGTVIDDAKVFNNKLQEREDYDNFHRPHGSQTPTNNCARRPRPARDASPSAL
jgi:hypothetical protein